MSNPKITQVTAFKSESTTEVYESYKDAVQAEVESALRTLLNATNSGTQFQYSAGELAQVMSENVAEFRKLIKLL